MSLNAEIQRQGNVTVIRLKGDITLGKAASQFRDLAEREIASGHTKLVLVMEEIRLVDSGGLAALLSAFMSAKKAGGELVLVALTDLVKHLLKVTGLIGVVDVFDTVDEAVKHLGDAPSPAAESGSS